MSETTFTKDKSARTLTMQRVFDAPREKVFKAFTTAESLNVWWGPRGWKTNSAEFELKPGGEWLYCMKCVDENHGEWFGQESWGKAVYESVDEPHGFTYRDYFCDAAGRINTEMPGSTIVMEFHELEGGKTEVVSTTTFDSEGGYDTVIAMGVEQGAGETWDRLSEYLIV